MATTLGEKYIVNSETGCWDWKVALNSGGYGTVSVNGKSKLAHRHLYEIYKTEIPKGLYLDHLCRNRKCVNPEHLEVVTFVENVRRGKNAKINIEKAKEIRSLYKNNKITQTYLSKKFGIGQEEISRIINFKRWATA